MRCAAYSVDFANRTLHCKTDDRSGNDQICCLILAPTFYSAALYFGGGVAIAHVAPDKAWIPTRWSKCGFLAADVISLVIQAVGGGIAGGAVGEPNNGAQIKRGSK